MYVHHHRAARQPAAVAPRGRGDQRGTGDAVIHLARQAVRVGTLLALLLTVDPARVIAYNINLPVLVAMIAAGLTLVPIAIALHDHVRAHPDHWMGALVAGLALAAAVKDFYEGITKAVFFHDRYVLGQHGLLWLQWVVVALIFWPTLRWTVAHRRS